MVAKRDRDKKRKPKEDERPKIKKETLKDLDPKNAETVKAGQGKVSRYPCPSEAEDGCLG